MSQFPKIDRFIGRFMELPEDHVNAYIVELESSVVLVDTTLTESSAKELRTKAEALGKPIKAVLLTHGHPEHYAGLVAFKDLPSYASQGCVDYAQKDDPVKASFFDKMLGDDYPNPLAKPSNIVEDGFVLSVDEAKFTFTDLGEGESDHDGMWSLIIGGVSHNFVGDVISLNTHCYVGDGHLFTWQETLKRFQKQFDPRSVRLYIGHGEGPVGMEAVDWQMGYNNTLINTVAVLQDRSIPVQKETTQQVWDAMKRYLPTDNNEFLLEMGLSQCIESLINERLFTTGQGRAYFLEQLMLMSSGDIDALIAKHYHKDAIMVTFDGMRRGHEELKKYYVDTLKIMGQITGLTTEYFAEIEDTIIFRATITSEGRGTVSAENGLYMKDGKIYRHIALTLLPDIDYGALGTKWVD